MERRNFLKYSLAGLATLSLPAVALGKEIIPHEKIPVELLSCNKEISQKNIASALRFQRNYDKITIWRIDGFNRYPKQRVERIYRECYGDYRYYVITPHPRLKSSTMHMSVDAYPGEDYREIRKRIKAKLRRGIKWYGSADPSYVTL